MDGEHTQKDKKKNLFSGKIFEAFRREPAKEKEDPVEGYHRYIDSGLEVLKHGEYEKVIEHFHNADEANKVGIHLDTTNAPLVYFNEDMTDGEVKDVVKGLSLRSKFSPQEKTLKIPQLFGIKDGTPLTPPPEIQHELALLSAEEWLHGLQTISGKNLTSELGHETDIAVYLDSKNVPLTDSFLDRYGRRNAVEEARKRRI